MLSTAVTVPRLLVLLPCLLYLVASAKALPVPPTVERRGLTPGTSAEATRDTIEDVRRAFAQLYATSSDPLTEFGLYEKGPAEHLQPPSQHVAPKVEIDLPPTNNKVVRDSARKSYSA